MGKNVKISSIRIICFILLWLVNPLLAAENFPAKEISLADWGFSDISQIGYAYIGVRHLDKGDELIIYDIRKRKPIVEEPRGLRGRVPSFTGDLFLVSRFDQGNINRLGGYFGGFVKEPSKYSLAIEKSPDNTPALAFFYTNTPPGFVGFWIHLFDFKEPPMKRVFLDASPFSYLTFSIRSEKGGEQLSLQMADRVWEKKEDSVKIGSVTSFIDTGKIDTKWQQVWVPLEKLPRQLNKKELAGIVFVVEGNSAGHIFINDLAFTTKRDVTVSREILSPSVKRPLKKGMWLWETEKILNDTKEQNILLDFCKSQGITDLYIQVPYKAKTKEAGNNSSMNGDGDDNWEIIWDPTPMRSLIAKLSVAHVRVHALDGDPRFALEKWHGRMLALIKRIVEYNKEVSPNERFVGIRYDNEPYLLPNFGGITKEGILRQYLSLLEKSKALTKANGIVLSADIPFWFDSLNEFFEPTAALNGRPMAEVVIDLLDNIGIMDYRTQAYGADGVIAHATDELRYASKKGKKISVGLETYSLPDETILEFSPDGNGKKLIIKKIAEGKAQITLIPEREKVETKGVVILGQTRAIQVPSGKITFHDKTLKELQEVEFQSASELLRFPSFEGFSIHSYESYRPWLEKQK